MNLSLNLHRWPGTAGRSRASIFLPMTHRRTCFLIMFVSCIMFAMLDNLINNSILTWTQEYILLMHDASESLTSNLSKLEIVNDSLNMQIAFQDKIPNLDIIRGFWTKSPTWTWINVGFNSSLPPNITESIFTQFSNGALTFIGDSQMLALYSKLMQRFHSCKSLNTKVEKCGQVTKYLGLKQRTIWKPPNRSRLEGPIAYGLSNPGCTDMAGGEWGRQVCMTRIDGGIPVTTEYLGVEFSRDLEMQNEIFDTTQESVISYLQNLTVRPSVILMNEGLHEVVAIDWASDIEQKFNEFRSTNFTSFLDFCQHWADVYEINLRWFLGLITSRLPGIPVVFISTSLMQGNEGGKNPGKNILIRHFNEKAASIMSSLGQNMVDVTPLLDNEECQPLYTDWIHLAEHSGVYYDVVWDLVLRRLEVIGGRL